jgi:hypothetical protein
MIFSRYFGCLAGSLLLVLPGKASESTTLTNITFRNHIQPVLARFGCSSGACHGAAAGQNGFKLSLRGYDDEGDYLALTRQALGRRIIPADPGRSLLLLKPTGAIPHKGGKRFDVGSLEYRVLADWIASGAPGPRTDDPRIERIEFQPEHVVLQPASTRQFTVRARFSDGHTEDVTRWAKYTSANASVAQVDDNGNVQVVGTGEGPITAWYLSRIAIASVTVPGTNSVSSAVFAKAQRRNFIDDLALEKLRELNLPPSPRCTDSEFIRRAFLDTIGVLPTAQETRQFLGSTGHWPVPSGDSTDGTGATARANGSGLSATAPAEVPGGGSPAPPIFNTDSEHTVPDNKRDRLIDSLLARTEFVDYWSHKWSDLLLVSSKRLKPAAMWTYYRFIRNHVAANTPWDVFVRKILTAQGSTLENGAGSFYVLHEDPRGMAETTTQAFLGMSINCAKCHNHPMEKWTNEQYYRFANLFARVRAKTGSGDGDAIIFVATQGDIVQPLTGKAQPPTPLDGQPLPIQDAGDRREALADWLTSRENPYFARSIANRVWANFFDVGIVEPVDDLRVTNPASNEKLLSAIANYLADQRFDLKALMRAILQSETYQRSSESLPENKADSRFYSRYYPRRLMAEVLLDAYSQVTGVPTEFQTDLRNENRGLGEKYPLGLRAIQLPDTKIASYFLKTFGRPDREKTCECERTAEPNIAQVLHIANGDSINQKLGAKENAISRLLVAKMPPDKVVEEVYLSALARYPTDPERDRMLKTWSEAKEAELRPLVEDMYWALMSSKEFLFNH